MLEIIFLGLDINYVHYSQMAHLARLQREQRECEEEEDGGIVVRHIGPRLRHWGQRTNGGWGTT